MTSSTSTGTRTNRLPAGELRRQVATYLTATPGTAFTPNQIASGLDRSAGAVANALTTLHTGGNVTQVSTSPMTFQANEKTGTIATSPARAFTDSARAPRQPKEPVSTALPTEPAVTGPVTRPNGQKYHPRKVADLPDLTVLRRLRTANVPVLLYGPPGTGKTSMIEAAFPDVITIPGDGDTTVADFVGEYTQTPEGRYVFVHGPLIRAMREGRVLFIDDATLIPASVLAVVYPAMDGRREIVVKANGGEIVTAAPGFHVVGGHNPGVHGAVLSEALASRFSVQIEVTTDHALAQQLGVDRRMIKIARNLATRQRNGEIGWSPQLRELLAFQRIQQLLGLDTAAANLIGVAPEADRPTVADAVRAAFGRAIPHLSLGEQI